MLNRIPKINLHLHLDGSFRMDTIWKLAHEQNVEMPADTIEGYEAFIRKCANAKDVNEYLKMFDTPLKCMQDKTSITRITEELIEDLANQGYIYAEIRFAPQLHTQKGLTQAEATEAVLEGRNNALKKYPNLRIGILTCMMCVGVDTLNQKENMETVEVCKQYLGKGVVGIDLAGAEGFVPLSNFGPLFAKAKEYGLPMTCHAGDSQGPDTVKDAMDFGVTRIGHGHHVYFDQELVERAKENKVLFEICPTSNVQCQTVPSYAKHPMKPLYDQGVLVSVNTDNDTFAGVHITDEYAHCIDDMGFTVDDIFQMNINAANAAFVTEEERKEFLEMMGLDKSGLDKLIIASYDILGLMSYLTVRRNRSKSMDYKKRDKRSKFSWRDSYRYTKRIY